MEKKNEELREIILKKNEQLQEKDAELKRKELDNLRLRDKLKGFGVFE